MEKCITDKVEKRINSAATFSVGLRKLIKEFPVTRTYTHHCGPGSVALVRNVNGKIERVWLVYDKNTNHPELDEDKSFIED